MANIEIVLNNFENDIKNNFQPDNRVVQKEVTNVNKKVGSFGDEFDEVAGLLNDDIKDLR